MTFLPLKRFVDPSRPITYGIVQAGEDIPDGVPYVRPVDMSGHDGVPDPSTLRTTSLEIGLQYRRSQITTGDIVVSIGPSYGKTMIVPAELDGANLTQGTARIAPANEVDRSFLRWALRSKHAIEHWDTAASGATFRALNLGPLAETPIPVHSLEEQHAIANFLDAETERIDALIAKKQRMIELLEGRRLAVIEEYLGGGRAAVSYLLEEDGHVHGAVPLKRLLERTIAGGTPDPNDNSYWTDEPDGLPWVAIGDMVDCSTTAETARRLTSHGLAAVRLSPAPVGTLLFAMYASLGKLTVTAGPCVWNQAILGLVPDGTRANSEFLSLWLEVLRQHLGVLARSTTQDNLNAEQVGGLPIPTWSLEEQNQLVAVLRPMLVGLATCASLIRRQIGLLREHRHALITAAVTGEIEVPGVAA